MKALVYEGPEDVKVNEVPVPKTPEGQVRVRVTYCGVCGSDIGIYSGSHPRAKAPLILGHEFIGVVEEVNGGTGKFKPGDRVTPYPLLSCGECYPCKNGMPHVCQSLRLIGIDVDGGMAEYVNCSEEVLFKLDDSLSDKAAAVIEPLAVIVRTLHQAKFQPLDKAVIIGAGPIGVLTGIMLKHSGAAQVIISDIDQARLAMCREFGLDTVHVRDEDLIEYVTKATDGVGADIVFECSGVEKSALEMSKVCRIGGTICMTGVHKVPHAVHLQDINFKEQTIVGSRVYTMLEFSQAVEYAKIIAEDLEKLVTHIVPLREADKIFDLIRDPNEDTVKVVVDCRIVSNEI